MKQIKRQNSPLILNNQAKISKEKNLANGKSGVGAEI